MVKKEVHRGEYCEMKLTISTPVSSLMVDGLNPRSVVDYSLQNELLYDRLFREEYLLNLRPHLYTSDHFIKANMQGA
jgi:hypothetical protein